MTRQQVESQLIIEGGLVSASLGRYTHPECPYFKINVEYQFERDEQDQGRAITGRDDKVIKVSEPYMGYAIID